MPILALGKALQRRNHLATLDALVEQYEKVRACQLEDSYDIALRQLRSIFFHNWHILFVRRDFLPGSVTGISGRSYRTIFTREQTVDKLVSLLQVYSAILIAQAEEVGDFEEFEIQLFALIGVVYNTGAKHVHHKAYERPQEWASVDEFQSYVEHGEILKNARKGKIGVHERDLPKGAAALLFDPEFTVLVPEAEDGMECELPLAKVLDIAAELLEDAELAEREKESRAGAGSEEEQELDRATDGQAPLDQAYASTFATSTLGLSLRPHHPNTSITKPKKSKTPPILNLTRPAPATEPALPSPQQRKPIPKIRLFRARSDTPAQHTPPPEPKPLEPMDLDMEALPAHSVRQEHEDQAGDGGFDGVGG